MTEISIPLDELFAKNGHLEQPADKGVPMDTPNSPQLDPVRGIFTTSTGVELRLSDKPISSLIVERLAQEGKPKIPMIEVTLLGKHRQLEANPNDPGYLALLAEWQVESKVRSLKYLFTVGVKGEPSQEFIEQHRSYFPGATEMDIKYLYICSLVPDGDIDALTEAIVGRTLPTAKGVDESANFTGAAPTDSL